MFLCALLGLCASCSSSTTAELSVDIVFSPAYLADSAEQVELYVVESCGPTQLGSTPQDPVKTITIDRAGQTTGLGSLPTGSYGLHALARGADCAVVAGACKSVEAVKGRNQIIALALSVVPPTGCPAGTSCRLAQCIGGEPDAGTDAGPDGTVDATVDAGMDGEVDAGPDGGMDAGTDAGPDGSMDAGTDAGPDGGGGADCSTPLLDTGTPRFTAFFQFKVKTGPTEHIWHAIQDPTVTLPFRPRLEFNDESGSTAAIDHVEWFITDPAQPTTSTNLYRNDEMVVDWDMTYHSEVFLPLNMTFNGGVEMNGQGTDAGKDNVFRLDHGKCYDVVARVVYNSGAPDDFRSRITVDAP